MNKFETKMIEKMERILSNGATNLGYCDDLVDDLDKEYKKFVSGLPYEPTEGWTFWRENSRVFSFDENATKKIEWILDFANEVCLWK